MDNDNKLFLPSYTSLQLLRSKSTSKIIRGFVQKHLFSLCCPHKGPKHLQNFKNFGKLESAKSCALIKDSCP